MVRNRVLLHTQGGNDLDLRDMPIELKRMRTVETEHGKRDISDIQGVYVKNNTPVNLVDVPAGKYVAFYLLNNVVMLRPLLSSGDLSTKRWYAVRFDDLFVESEK